ncbi:molybdopterin-containing oxidoreductase family membrane subunit [Desulfitispora alkaliphila]|uniref:NrfD/PsrC family molybdoenzyme membrane anchor subunit n=1 Tax=Desulfitispora alkaliphila TaxID=622674 RepID=UPI003D20A8F8
MKNLKGVKILALALAVFGLAGAITILIQGEQAMGVNDQVPWGSLIATYLFFALSSVGLTLVASLWYIFKVEAFKITTKRALALAIISIVLGFIAIGLELGNPLSMIWILLSPNLSSGIWWMGSLYSLYLGFRIITVYFIYKGDDQKVVLFSRLTVFAALAAVGNLGAVFGNLTARPYWNGAAIPLYFLVVAILSGAAILAITFYFVEKKEQKNTSSTVMPLLGKIMMIFIGVTAFFKFWHLINNIYGGAYGKYEAAMAQISGPLSFQFWGLEVGLALILPFLILATPGGFKSSRVFLAAMLSIAGTYFMHNNFVAAGQVTPLGIIEGTFTGVYHSYQVLWAEWAILLGALGGAIFLAIWIEDKFFSPTPASIKTIGVSGK